MNAVLRYILILVITFLMHFIILLYNKTVQPTRYKRIFALYFQFIPGRQERSNNIQQINCL